MTKTKRMTGGGASLAEGEPFDMLIAIVIMIVGWIGILFIHMALPYPDNRRSSSDIFDPNEETRRSSNDRPFWFITFSSMIVFSIIFILINNISYNKDGFPFDNSSQGKTAIEDMLFAFSLFKNRFQIFFSEIFFMMTFIIFLWLNYRFYDAFKYRASVPIIRNTIYFFIAFTGLNIIIFCASYFFSFVSDDDSKPNGLLQSMNAARLRQPLLSQQLANPNVKSNLKYFSTVIFISSMTCLMILYIYLSFYMTDDKL